MNESSLAPTNAAPQPPLSHGSWRRVARRGKHAALQHLLGRDAPTHPLALSRTRQAPTKSEGQRLRRGDLISIGFGAKESQFFAPKISRVEAPPPAIPSAFGWRKLVRFKAKAGAAADANGMELLYFLQNIFEKSPTGNPLDADRNVSLFNRVIATRKVGLGPYSQSKRALYFFADGPRVKCDQAGTPVTCAGGNVPSKVGGQFQDDGAIGFSLKATSDIRNPETEQEDFTALHQLEALSPPHHGILYDGGPALGATQFKKAFDIIRRKWLELHNSVAVGAARHGLPQQRGFRSATMGSGERAGLHPSL